MFLNLPGQVVASVSSLRNTSPGFGPPWRGGVVDNYIFKLHKLQNRRRFEMPQKKILYDGVYKCPVCNITYEVKDADPGKGDGYCDDCVDGDDNRIVLTYLPHGEALG